MGKLKKGSAAAKAWGAKMRRLRKKPKSKSKSPSIKRKKTIKSRVRKMPKKKRKASRKSASIFGINTNKALAAGLYGAARARISNFIAPYTSRIPAGAVTDEVGMVVALTLLKKFALKKAGILRDAVSTGRDIEFARIGEAVATGQINLGALAAGTDNAGGFYTN